ncbi:hypothetical protein NBRC116601_02550 [Cognatishimia sp. WU-CL00825]|uniref:SRPBCC family protein n=1 Tax=Cognatishimia sp. WU-CL00825 TaxID=3127658 RepID=UPI00310AA99B
MKVSRSLTINASPDVIWSKLVDDFVPLHEWMAAIKSSTARPGPALPGAPAAGRDAAIGPGAPGTIMEEVFTHLDRSKNLIEFETVLNAPNFNPIKGWSNRITLTPQGEATLVTWSIVVQLRLMGHVMRFPIKKSLRAGFLRSLQEVAHIIETGQPHPRKAKSFASEAANATLATAAS